MIAIHTMPFMADRKYQLRGGGGGGGGGGWAGGAGAGRGGAGRWARRGGRVRGGAGTHGPGLSATLLTMMDIPLRRELTENLSPFLMRSMRGLYPLGEMSQPEEL